MAVADAMRTAAIRLVGQRPQAFYDATGQLEIELCDLVNEVAEEIMQYRDWQAMVKFHTITSTGTGGSFPLPADYSKMLLNSELEQNNWLWGYHAVPDVNQFHYYRDRGLGLLPGVWTLYDNQIHIAPTPAAGNVADFPYISKNYATGQGNVKKSAFDADTDEFFLPDRILALGLIWRWRENKRLEGFDADRDKFILALDGYASRDKGSRPIARNSNFRPAGVSVAWPWPLGG